MPPHGASPADTVPRCHAAIRRGAPHLAWARALAIATGTVALAACRADHGGSATLGAITIRHAVVPVPTAPDEAAAFLVIENTGDVAQQLDAVTTPDAARATVHQSTGGRMEPVASLTIASHSGLSLKPGGLHLMLGGLTRALALADTVTLQLRFTPAGEVVVRAPVLRYTEAVSEVP